MLLILFAAIGNHSSPSRKIGRSRSEDNGRAEGEGTREGGKEREGQRTCRPHSPSLHVSFCFTAFVAGREKKKPAEPPSALYYCHPVSERLRLSPVFLCWVSSLSREKGRAVNSSTNELALGGSFPSVVDFARARTCFINFMS